MKTEECLEFFLNGNEKKGKPKGWKVFNWGNNSGFDCTFNKISKSGSMLNFTDSRRSSDVNSFYINIDTCKIKFDTFKSDCFAMYAKGGNTDVTITAIWERK